MRRVVYMVRPRRLVLSEHERASRLAELAYAVRERREDLGLRQGELADLADCSTRFVSMVEHAKPTVQLDKLLDLLEVLGFELVLRRGRGGLVVDAAAARSRRAIRS
jgi:HTH-type transcriptional regulator/antitoxin HipB